VARLAEAAEALAHQALPSGVRTIPGVGDAHQPALLRSTERQGTSSTHRACASSKASGPTFRDLLGLYSRGGDVLAVAPGASLGLKVGEEAGYLLRFDDIVPAAAFPAASAWGSRASGSRANNVGFARDSCALRASGRLL
jgi:hypothetical protein